MNRHISDIHKCILYTYVWHTNNILFFSYKLMLKLIYAHKFVHLLWVFSFSFLSARSHSSFFLRNSIVIFYSFFVRIPSFKPTFRMSFFSFSKSIQWYFAVAVAVSYIFIYTHTHAHIHGYTIHSQAYSRTVVLFLFCYTRCKCTVLIPSKWATNQRTNKKKKKKNRKKIL